MRDTFGSAIADLVVVGAVVLVVAALRPPDAGGAPPDAGRRRSPPELAPGGRGAHRRLGRLLGVRRRARAPARASRPRAAPTSPCRKCAPCRSDLRDSSTLRRRAPGRPISEHAPQPAPGRPSRQGRPARVRRELRQARGGGLPVLAVGRRRPRRRDPATAAAGFSARSGWLTSSTFGGASWLAHATLQSGTWVNSPGPLRRARRERPPHAGDGVRARRLADSRRPRRTSGRGRRGPPSTATTGSTTAATSATAARRTGLPRCPTSTCCSACSGSSSRSRTPAAVRRGRSRVEPHAVDAHPAVHPLGAASGDGSIFNRLHVDGSGLTDTQQGYSTSIMYTLRHAVLLRSALRRATTSCSSCSATTSPRESSAVVRATTCRSRSSPTTRSAEPRSPTGAGWTACGPTRRRRLWLDERLPEPIPHRDRLVTCRGRPTRARLVSARSSTRAAGRRACGRRGVPSSPGSARSQRICARRSGPAQRRSRRRLGAAGSCRGCC